MTVALTTALLFGVVSGFILERRLMLRDMREERKDWARERGTLLNRIKPETAQVVDLGGPEPELVQPPPMDNDSAWWASQGVEQ